MGLEAQKNWLCAMIIQRLKRWKADEVLAKYRLKLKDLKTPEDLLELYLGQMYEEANILDQVEMHFRKAHELNPQSLDWSYQLAKFLIYNDISTDEGMELINKLLGKKLMMNIHCN
jgi:tetratricopeptide (TPR) repeat protein